MSGPIITKTGSAVNLTRKKTVYKYNNSAKGKAARKRYEQTKKGKEATKRYRQSTKGKAVYTRYSQTEKGKATHKRYAIHNLQQVNATRAVNHAVRDGKLPRANTRNCTYCKKPAQEYHHWHGYAKEHWLDVIPICSKCHSHHIAPSMIGPTTV